MRARVELGQNGGEPQGSVRDRRGLPLEDLFEAMENTALLEGSREEFLEARDALKGQAAFGAPRAREEYHPAYRIVGGEFIEGLIE